jgi:hypothetical protein
MRWAVRLELVREDGITATRELATITRPMADLRPEEIGLTLGRRALARSRC